MEPPPQDPHGGFSRGQAGSRVVPDVPGTASSVPNGQSFVPPEWLQQQTLGFGQAPMGMSMDQMLFLMQMQQQMTNPTVAFMGLQASGMSANQAGALMNLVQQNAAFNSGQPQNLSQGFSLDPAQVYRLMQARQALTQVQAHAAQNALAAQLRAQFQAQAQAQAALAQSRNLAQMQAEVAAANMRSQASGQMIMPEAEEFAREAAAPAHVPPAPVLCEPQSGRSQLAHAEQKQLAGLGAQGPRGAAQDDFAKFNHPNAQQSHQVEALDERLPAAVYYAGVGHRDDQVRSGLEPTGTSVPQPGSGRDAALQSGYPVLGGRPVDEVLMAGDLASVPEEPNSRLGGTLGREVDRGPLIGERPLMAADQGVRPREPQAGNGQVGPSPGQRQQGWRVAEPGHGEWRAADSVECATAARSLPDQERRQQGSGEQYVEGHGMRGSHQSAQLRKPTNGWNLNQGEAFHGSGGASYAEQLAGRQDFLRDSFLDDGAMPLQREGPDAQMKFAHPVHQGATGERSAMGDRRCLKRMRMDGDTGLRESAEEVVYPGSRLAVRDQQHVERDALFEGMPQHDLVIQDDSATSTEGEMEKPMGGPSSFAASRNPSFWVQGSSVHGHALDHHASAPLDGLDSGTSFQPPKAKCVPQSTFPSSTSSIH